MKREHSQKSAILMRYLKVSIRNPREGLDRLRIKFKTSRSSSETEFGNHLDVMALQTDPAAWLDDVATQLGFHGVPSERIEENDVVEILRSRTTHDADPALLQVIGMVLERWQPRFIIETGVARGLTTATILRHLASIDGPCHLFSLDLPPLSDPWYSLSCDAVPRHLKNRGDIWSYIRGDTRRTLPALIDRLATVEMFIHDSLHTMDHMMFEFNAVIGALQPGSVLIFDDVDNNTAFSQMCRTDSIKHHMVARHVEKTGYFGVAVVK